MANEFRGIAFFDSDGTITLENSNGVFARNRGMAELHASLEESRYHDRITSGMYNGCIAPVYEGLTLAEVMELCEKIPVIDGVAETTAELAINGIMSVIVTCGVGDVARIIKERFGFHRYFGAELEFDDHGIATGYRTSLIGIEHKPVIVDYVCGQSGIPVQYTFGIGDSMSDIPMFKRVGVSIAINYDPRVDGHARHYIKNSGSLYDVVPIILEVVGRWTR